MTFDQRRRWIIDWLKAAQARGDIAAVDVLNQAFSDAYLKSALPKFMPVAFGAHRCPQLGCDLLQMTRDGFLTRKRVGLYGFAGQGFPKWVWVYELAETLR